MRDFVARFNTAILEVRDLNEDIAIMAMMRDLRRSKFVLTFWIKLSFELMLNSWSTHTSTFVWMRVLLIDARQKERIRKRSKKKK